MDTVFDLNAELKRIMAKQPEQIKARARIAYANFLDGQQAMRTYIAHSVFETHRQEYFGVLLQKNEMAFAEQIAAERF